MLKRHHLAIIFLIFIFILIISTYKDYGVPWDEKVFFNTGKYFVVKLFNYLKIPTNLSTGAFEPTPYHLKGHGVFMDMLTVFAALLFRNFNFETLHLIRALFALPIFFLLYWIISKLFSKVYGLISLVFLLLFPRFYPEIYYNAVDIPTTLLFTICLAYFIYYAGTKQTFLKSILFGLILGITINQRLLLFYLPIINFVFLLFLKRRNIKQLTIQQLTIFLSTIFFMHLTHPYLLTHPITGLFKIISHSKQYPWNAAVLFEGKFFSNLTIPLPWYYLPKTMLITIPLTTIVLFFLGNIKILTNLVRPHQIGSDSQKKWMMLYLVSIFYLPLILVFILKPTLYDSWRQFLFLTIPLIIITMFGLSHLFSLKFRVWKFGFVWRLVIGLLVIISLAITAFEMITLHPYQYLYSNSLVGGLKGAYINYETDYWGLGFKEAAIWFNHYLNNPTRQYKIYLEGDPLSSLYYLKPNVKLITDPNEADYVLTFTRWDFDKRHLGKTIHVVKKKGVPLIYIKEGGEYIEELETRKDSK